MVSIEAIAAIDASGTLKTFYFADDYLVTQAGDTPVLTAFLRRILDPGTIKRNAYSDGMTGGATLLEIGTITLANQDGALDALADYSFDGRAATVRNFTSGAYPAAASTIIIGTIDGVEASFQTLTLRLRDKQWMLKLPASSNTYGGANTLPNGLDGGAQDIKGQNKPKAYGQFLNAPFPCVNTARLIYQAHDGLLGSIDAVYGAGLAITTGAQKTVAQFNAGSNAFTFTVNTTTDIATTSGVNSFSDGDGVYVTTTTTLPAPLVTTTQYFWHVLSTTTGTFHLTKADALANANHVDLTTTGTGTQTVDNNTTVPGCYDWCLDSTGSYIRLGSQQSGQVTGSGSQGATSANRTVAQVLKAIATDAGVTSISAADVAALDALNSAVCGIWFTDTTTSLSAMDQIASSIGAWYGFDRTATLRMGQLNAPTGVSVGSIRADQVIALERLPPRDTGIPAWRVSKQYAKNYTVQTSGLAGAVTPLRTTWLAQQNRLAQSADASIKTQWQQAQDINLPGLLVNQADADTEAARLLTLFKVKRGLYRVTVNLDDALAISPNLTAELNVTYPRFGMSAGKDLIVLSEEVNLEQRRVIWDLWG